MYNMLALSRIKNILKDILNIYKKKQKQNEKLKK